MSVDLTPDLDLRSDCVGVFPYPKERGVMHGTTIKFFRETRKLCLGILLKQA